MPERVKIAGKSAEPFVLALFDVKAEQLSDLAREETDSSAGVHNGGSEVKKWTALQRDRNEDPVIRIPVHPPAK